MVLELLPERYNFFTQLLHYPYDSAPPICHTPQHHGVGKHTAGVYASYTAAAPETAARCTAAWVSEEVL